MLVGASTWHDARGTRLVLLGSSTSQHARRRDGKLLRDYVQWVRDLPLGPGVNKSFVAQWDTGSLADVHKVKAHLRMDQSEQKSKPAQSSSSTQPPSTSEGLDSTTGNVAQGADTEEERGKRLNGLLDVILVDARMASDCMREQAGDDATSSKTTVGGVEEEPGSDGNSLYSTDMSCGLARCSESKSAPSSASEDEVQRDKSTEGPRSMYGAQGKNSSEGEEIARSGTTKSPNPQKKQQFSVFRTCKSTCWRMVPTDHTSRLMQLYFTAMALYQFVDASTISDQEDAKRQQVLLEVCRASSCHRLMCEIARTRTAAAVLLEELQPLFEDERSSSPVSAATTQHSESSGDHVDANEGKSGLLKNDVLHPSTPLSHAHSGTVTRQLVAALHGMASALDRAVADFARLLANLKLECEEGETDEDLRICGMDYVSVFIGVVRQFGEVGAKLWEGCASQLSALTVQLAVAVAVCRCLMTPQFPSESNLEQDANIDCKDRYERLLGFLKQAGQQKRYKGVGLKPSQYRALSSSLTGYAPEPPQTQHNESKATPTPCALPAPRHLVVCVLDIDVCIALTRLLPAMGLVCSGYTGPVEVLPFTERFRHRPLPVKSLENFFTNSLVLEQEWHRRSGDSWQVDVQQCARCGVAGGKLLACSRCQAVRYCSQPCQTAHWAEHSQTCRATQKKNTAVGGERDGNAIQQTGGGGGSTARAGIVVQSAETETTKSGGKKKKRKKKRRK